MVAYDTTIAGLFAYKAWRKSLTPLNVGEIVQFDVFVRGIYKEYDIKVNSAFKIKNVDTNRSLPADFVYEMVRCNQKGKEFKRKIYWSVEEIARRLAKYEVSLIKY